MLHLLLLYIMIHEKDQGVYSLRPQLFVMVELYTPFKEK